jgi:hypothetical protein
MFRLPDFYKSNNLDKAQQTNAIATLF